MPNYSQALADKVVDSFTITTIGTKEPLISSGNLIASGDFVLLKIKGGFEFALVHHKEFRFDLNFIANRLTYEVQHYALKWLEDHNLFMNLIENPLYENSPLITVPDTPDNTFR